MLAAGTPERGRIGRTARQDELLAAGRRRRGRLPPADPPDAMRFRHHRRRVCRPVHRQRHSRAPARRQRRGAGGQLRRLWRERPQRRVAVAVAGAGVAADRRHQRRPRLGRARPQRQAARARRLARRPAARQPGQGPAPCSSRPWAASPAARCTGWQGCWRASASGTTSRSRPTAAASRRSSCRPTPSSPIAWCGRSPPAPHRTARASASTWRWRRSRKRPGGAVLRLAGGRQVRASCAIVCTNGYTGSIAVRSRPRAKVLRNYMLATEPLDAEAVARLGNGEAFTVELNKSYIFYRLHEGRLVYGGIETFLRTPPGDFDVPGLGAPRARAPPGAQPALVQGPQDRHRLGRPVPFDGHRPADHPPCAGHQVDRLQCRLRRHRRGADAAVRAPCRGHRARSAPAPTPRMRASPRSCWPPGFRSTSLLKFGGGIAWDVIRGRMIVRQ